jgi:hypothetical protein
MKAHRHTRPTATVLPEDETTGQLRGEMDVSRQQEKRAHQLVGLATGARSHRMSNEYFWYFSLPRTSMHGSAATWTAIALIGTLPVVGI